MSEDVTGENQDKDAHLGVGLKRPDESQALEISAETRNSTPVKVSNNPPDELPRNPADLSDDELLASTIERARQTLADDEDFDSWNISLSINNKTKIYMIPWHMCSSFDTVYVGSNTAKFKAIATNDFLISSKDGIIMPSVYNKLVRYKSNLGIFVPRSAFDAFCPPKMISRLQDDEDALKDLARGGFPLWSMQLEGPVSFEIYEPSRGTLPALELRQSINCSVDADPLQKPELIQKDLRLGIRPTDYVQFVQLHIHSHYLMNIIRSVVEYSYEADKQHNSMLVCLKDGIIDYPYLGLLRYLEEIEGYKTDEQGLRSKHSSAYNQICDTHVDLLVQFLRKNSVLPLETLQNQWSEQIPITSFGGIAFLLKPGDDVYVMEKDGSLNAYVVASVKGGVSYPVSVKIGRSIESYIVSVWNLAFDGNKISYRSKKVLIPPFENEKDILLLPVFPVRFKDNADNGRTKNSLMERGKRYFEYCKTPSFLEYVSHEPRSNWKECERTRIVIDHSSKPWERHHYLSQSLIYGDRASATETNHMRRSLFEDILHADGKSPVQNLRTPICECVTCKNSRIDKHSPNPPPRFGDYRSIVPGETKSLTNHQYLLLHYEMYAFFLKDRRFGIIDIGYASPPKMVKNAIDRLVMDVDKKDAIKGIVEIYTDQDSTFLPFRADFIQGKGEGQIILLHGPPGTGKTLTAESVAEFTKRPLLQLTGADLGDDVVILKKNLLTFFRDANNWDAVVLLDEADIYLEERTVDDLRRNSIVSIFLRALDYFKGILFLTTNRVGRINEAFMSRIHVAIGYDRLNEAARAQIWRNLFDKLKDDSKRTKHKIGIDHDARQFVEKDKELINLQWNGREIRNAFQTAVALAVYDSRKKENDSDESGEETAENEEKKFATLEEKHLKQVVRLSSAFKMYMKSTKGGMGESDNAYLHGIRDDDHNNPKKVRNNFKDRHPIGGQ